MYSSLIPIILIKSVIPFITEEHDTGIVRQLKDLAQSGGGILTPEMTDTKGLTYFAEDIDGSWWIVATSTKCII